MAVQNLRFTGSEFPVIQDAITVASKLQDLRYERKEDLTLSADGSRFSVRNIPTALQVDCQADMAITSIEFKILCLEPATLDDGRYHFRVPNNQEGRAFLKRLAEYLNTETYEIRQRGRGPRNGRDNYHDLPLDEAKEIAVYLNIRRNK